MELLCASVSLRNHCKEEKHLVTEGRRQAAESKAVRVKDDLQRLEKRLERCRGLMGTERRHGDSPWGSSREEMPRQAQVKSIESNQSHSLQWPGQDFERSLRSLGKSLEDWLLIPDVELPPGPPRANVLLSP